jgi:sulfate adenylyltransferase
MAHRDPGIDAKTRQAMSDRLSAYGPFDAHHIFDTLWEGALQTRPLKIDITFFRNKCFGMATGKTCPHGDEDRIHISGTQQCAMLAEGAPVPREFGRPEVIEILRAYYASLSASSQ